MTSSLVGCQNENDVFGELTGQSDVTITASMENGSESRTSLGGEDNKSVLWQEADKLSIFLGNTTNQKFGIYKGVGETTAEFKGEEGLIISGGAESDVTSFANVGYYPYAENVSLSQTNGEYVVSVSLPAVQEFVDGSFGQNASPMVAVTESKNDLSFSLKNAATLFKMPLKGTAKIIKASVKSAAHGLAGDATITAKYSYEENEGPALVMGENTSNTITLDCGEGVQLKSDEETMFVFVVPPTTYEAKDLTFTFYDSEGKCMTETITKKDYTVKRNEPLKFNARIYEGTTDAPTEIKLLQQAIEDGEASYTLINDLAVSGEDKIEIPSGTTFTLDLNGNTLSGSNLDFLDNSGTLTIKNGKVEAGDAENSRRCIYNRSGGELTIDGVEFVQTYDEKGAAINNAGVMTIEDATVTSNYFSIWNEANGELTINGGTYTCNSYNESADSNYSYAIMNQGGAKLTINGGTFNCTHGFAALYGGSETTVNGGEVNYIGQYKITTCAFDVYDATTKLTVNDCKVKWTSNEGSKILRLNEGVTVSNIEIKGGLYNDNIVANNTGSEFIVKFVDSGDATYPYKAVDAGCKAVANGYEIYNVDGLKWLADQVNNEGNTFKGTTVTLTASIDLNDEAWTPIGAFVDGAFDFDHSFQGSFDGGNNTISNLKVTVEDGAAGLFGGVQNCGTIKNVKLSDVTVSSNRLAGALIGWIQENDTRTLPVVSGCEATNVTVTVTPDVDGSTYDNGDKAGGLIGYAAKEVKIENCKVTTATITGYRDLGGIVGCSLPAADSDGVTYTPTIDGCEATSITIVQDLKNGYKEDYPTTLGAVYGRGEALGTSTSEVTSMIVKNCSTTYAQGALDAANTPRTIELLAGEYGDLLFNVNEESELIDGYYYMTNYDSNFYGQEGWQFAKRVITGLTITGVEGTVINSLTATDPRCDEANAKGTRNNLFEISNLKISGVTIGKEIYFNSSNTTVATSTSETTLMPAVKIEGLTLENCKTTTGGSTLKADGRKLLGIANTGTSSNVKNVSVTGCTITDTYQGVYVVDGENVIISNNSFTNLTHNAIHINKHCSGTINITGNTIHKDADRPIRFYGVQAGTVSITSNIITESGDDDGELYKAEEMGSGVNVTWNNNTADGTEIVLSTTSGVTVGTKKTAEE